MSEGYPSRSDPHEDEIETPEGTWKKDKRLAIPGNEEGVYFEPKKKEAEEQ